VAASNSAAAGVQSASAPSQTGGPDGRRRVGSTSVGAAADSVVSRRGPADAPVPPAEAMTAKKAVVNDGAGGAVGDGGVQPASTHHGLKGGRHGATGRQAPLPAAAANDEANARQRRRSAVNII